MNVLENIIGIRWGQYCGSPILQEPKIIYSYKTKKLITSLVPLHNGHVFGLSPKETLVVKINRERGKESKILKESRGFVVFSTC